MKVYIASSKKHLGKIEEDIYFCKKYNDLDIETKIEIIENIIKKAKSDDIVILKSIWGYYNNPNLFLQQIKKLQNKKINLINNYKFVYWNIDKIKYLNNIKKLNIIPIYTINTLKLKTEEKYLRKILKNIDSDEVVVKPSIGESGYLTKKFNKEKEYKELIKFIIKNKNTRFILQPFIKEISGGEISVININGMPLYGVRRYPGILSKKEDTIYIERKKLPKKVINESKKINDFLNKKFKSSPNICRIDFIKTKDSFKLLEVELIDPDLFFRKIPENIKQKTFSLLEKSIKK